MTLPPPLFFAIVGYFSVFFTLAVVLICVAGWVFHRAVNVAWWVRARVAVRNRPLWIPPAPAPMNRWKPRPGRRRLTDEDIEARLRLLGAELLAEHGDDFVTDLGLLAKNDHTDH